MSCARSLTLVVYRSLGRYTRQDMYRPYRSRRRNSLVCLRSLSRSTPSAIGVSSSAEISNSSSRGKSSSISTRSFPSWLSGGSPAVARTWASLRRSTGMPVMGAVCAACVYRPRNLNSPVTVPSAPCFLTET